MQSRECRLLEGGPGFQGSTEGHQSLQAGTVRKHHPLSLVRRGMLVVSTERALLHPRDRLSDWELIAYRERFAV